MQLVTKLANCFVGQDGPVLSGRYCHLFKNFMRASLLYSLRYPRLVPGLLLTNLLHCWWCHLWFSQLCVLRCAS